MNKKGENYLKWRITFLHPFMILNKEEDNFTETLDGARIETIEELGDMFFLSFILNGVFLWIWFHFLNYNILSIIALIIFGIFIIILTYFCIGFFMHIINLLNPNESFIKIYFKRRR